MTSKSDIIAFYDDFAPRQQRAAFNQRHRLLYDQIRALGVRSDSSILEVGCGVGAVTTLLARTVKSGPITAIDISPKSIEIARHACPADNVHFIACDISSYEGQKSFDFILLCDVLEHIPMGEHEMLFRRLSAVAHENTILFVNIPNPAALQYIKHDHEADLQIVDEPIPANILLNNAYREGWVLDHFSNYGVWNKNEFQRIVFKRPELWRPDPLPQKTSLFERTRLIWGRIRRRILG